MKKHFLKLSILSGLVLAATTEAKTSRFDGWSVGVAGGYLKDDSTNSGAVPGVGSWNDDGYFRKSTGLSAGIFAGYGHVLPYDIYAGVEAKYTYLNNYDVGYTVNGVATKLTHKQSYHLSLKLGKVFEESYLAYGKIGYVNSEMNFHSPEVNSSIVLPVYSKNRNIGGYELGVGVSGKISDCFDLGLEVSQTYIEKHKYTQASDSNQFYHTIKPRLMNVELRLTYKL